MGYHTLWNQHQNTTPHNQQHYSTFHVRLRLNFKLLFHRSSTSTTSSSSPCRLFRNNLTHLSTEDNVVPKPIQVRTNISNIVEINLLLFFVNLLVLHGSRKITTVLLNNIFFTVSNFSQIKQSSLYMYIKKRSYNVADEYLT